jgi:DNA-directed RNA polymerase specialized sigma24 family protein
MEPMQRKGRRAHDDPRFTRALDAAPESRRCIARTLCGTAVRATTGAHMKHAIWSAAVGLRVEVTCERHVAGTDRELRRLRLQIAAWPERMRQVFTLRKVYGLHPRSIARRLGLSEHEVEQDLIGAALACAGCGAAHGSFKEQPLPRTGRAIGTATAHPKPRP